MILDWVAQIPVVVAGVLVVFGPGILALWGVGLRGLSLVAAAPLFGVVTVGATALFFGAVGIPWSPLGWGVTALLIAGLAWVIARVLGNRLPSAPVAGPRWSVIAGLVIGAAIAVWRLTAYIGSPDAISQTNDAVFHMNAVRFAVETADASSLHINAVIGGNSFYPAAWHGIVSLVVMMTGASVAAAANAITLVIGALIWPLGIAWLAREVSSSRAVAAYAAILSSALQIFPLLLFQWGVLFPNALSMALVPAGVALVMALWRWSAGTTPWRAGIRGALLVLVVVGALLLSQPSAFLPWALISVIWLTFRLLGGAPVRRALALVLVAVSWIILAALWAYLAQGTTGSHWPPIRGKLAVLVDILLNGQVMIPFAYGVSLLMVLGLIVAVRRSNMRWLAVAWVAVSALYFLVATVGNPFVRNAILGAWYADPYRIAAIAPVVVIPLAALGVDAVVRTVTRRFGHAENDSIPTLLAVSGTAVFMIVLVLVRPVAMPEVTEGTVYQGSTYRAGSDTYLSPDERELLESLPDRVAADDRVLGNPSTGSGFGYFLSGLDVYPRTWAPPRTDAWQVLAMHLRDAETEAAVCDALELYGSPEYVLDFGPGEAEPGRYVMPGMTDFEGQDGFEFVAEQGDASLWRITACDE
ncbi:hypothetical protein M2317_000483 [Microbacterium sp. ZKA21]|uniref:DUF6541 family protein n=1 Tax=Microbacterium sp. ZKA21 TaxID=3381694 RepID=UPI003D18FE13